MSARRFLIWASGVMIACLVVAVGAARADSVSPQIAFQVPDDIDALNVAVPTAQSPLSSNRTELNNAETLDASLFVTSLPIPAPSAANPSVPSFRTTEHPDRPLGARSHKRPRFDPDTDQSTVPEPATLLLLGTGLVGIAAIRRRLRA